MGDLAAPKGSHPWCVAVREEARAALQSAKHTREQVVIWVEGLQEDGHFRVLADAKGNHFLTWEGLCECPPPYGFGMTAQAVQALIDSKPLAQRLAAPEAEGGEPPLAEHGTNQHSQNSGHEEGGSNTTSSARDRGVPYLVRRLKRDAPAVAEALAQGKYKSARAAGIAAGIVKVPTRLEKVERCILALSPEERAELNRWLEAHP
jgi:hypothetical protein